MPEQIKLDAKQVTEAILATIEKDREKEIVSRRFGLFDRKETLEQIGELLGITRERVRQLEKAIVTRLKSQAQQGSITALTESEAKVIEQLKAAGNVSRISNLTDELTGESDKISQARVAFIVQLSPNLVSLDENDLFYPAGALKDIYKDAKNLNKEVLDIVATIKEVGKPISLANLSKKINKDQATTNSLASISKQLSSLNGDWGLSRWPAVNPKNIRDKIYVILKENGKQMHFSEIADKIQQSDFKRKDVTTQAIHNELIKDSRFVLVGRGIYALKEWGYKKGTVADVIAEILKKADEPLHRDEIVKRVLKNRYVKETTILLNLQGKPQFKRVAKATYTLADA
ncbi:hypothetical protein KC950_01315 [Candidatus Saccharibacteria bacterium]|nr:hypothetical protein [Candidatus Saccharibacteria bacterium]